MLPFLQALPLLQWTHTRKKELIARTSQTQKSTLDNPQPCDKPKYSAPDDINRLSEMLLRLTQHKYNKLLKSPTFFVIDDDRIIGVQKRLSLVEMFPGCPNLKIVWARSAEVAIEQLQRCHTKQEPPLVVFMDRNFYFRGEITSEAEEEVLNKIEELFGTSVTVVSISNMYKTEGQDGIEHSALIDLATKKSASLTGYLAEIEKCIQRKILSGNLPTCLDLSRRQSKVADDQPLTTISKPEEMPGLASASRSHSVFALRSPQHKSTPITMPVTPSQPEKRSLELNSCTVLMIGDNTQLEIFKKTLIKMYREINVFQFIVANGVPEAEKKLKELYDKRTPPTLVLTIGNQDVITDKVNELFVRVTLCRVHDDKAAKIKVGEVDNTLEDDEGAQSIVLNGTAGLRKKKDLIFQRMMFHALTGGAVCRSDADNEVSPMMRGIVWRK